jgi:hypothetical protein
VLWQQHAHNDTILPRQTRTVPQAAPTQPGNDPARLKFLLAMASAFSLPVSKLAPWPRELGFARSEAFFDRVAAGRRLTSLVAWMALVVVACSAGYGWSFGLWRSTLLAAYVAIKLPLLLVITTSLVMMLNWILAQLMGSGLRLMQVAALTYRAMSVASLALLSLVPVCALFALAWPPPQPREDLAHNLLLLMHVFFVACAGVYGNTTLLQGMRRLCRPGTPIIRLYASWLASNVVVGCQLAWILRPFMGSPNYPVAFLREDALEGNFYEFVFVTIIWKHLLGG